MSPHPLTLRVAVIGLGVGKGHIQAYAEIPDLFELKAVCDLDADKARATAAEFGVAWHTASLAELLASDDIDVIDICTPPNTHLSLIEQALAAGKHVVCEKPLVGSLREADVVAAALRGARGQLFPIFQYRFGNGLQRLKHLQAKGLARHALITTMETHWRRDSDYYRIAWRGKWATEMGGVCLTQACHAHDILSYVHGPVKTVYAKLATRVNDIEGEDCAAITVELANGSLAVLSATLGAAVETSRLRFVFGDMTVESDSPEPYRPGKEPWRFVGKTAQVDAAIAAALADFQPMLESFAGQFARIHACITQGATTPVALDDARASLELITAIYYSAESATPQTLPIDPEHPRYASWVPAARGFPKALAS
ncbi:MAG: Gfo/Idh/MocA family oxidoreductase [Pseudomonadota bacterium]